MNKRNLSPSEAADFIGCSAKLIYELIKDGALPAFPLRGMVRGALRIPAASVVAYEREQARRYAEKNGIILHFPTD
jgi:excisionase family DNA binding protein